MSQFALHPEAFADLDEIRELIANENLDAADRLMDEFFSEFRMLAEFPRLGHSRPELSSKPIRFRVLREYLIAYAPDESPLWILAVLHGRRNPRVIAAILRGRG